MTPRQKGVSSPKNLDEVLEYQKEKMIPTQKDWDRLSKADFPVSTVRPTNWIGLISEDTTGIEPLWGSQYINRSQCPI